MNILILCGKYGMGHFSAANSIKEQIEINYPKSKIKVVDFVEYTFPTFHKILYKTFEIMTTKLKTFFALLYPIAANNKKNNIIIKSMANSLDRILEDEKADIIITTLPEIAKAFTIYKNKKHCSIPFVTCVTDISEFYEWVNFVSNLYLVPTQSVKDYLISNGVCENTITVSGIPVKHKFYKFKKKQTKKTHIVIMGGGIGNIPIEKIFYEQISVHSEINITILCAKNKKLFNKLNNKYPNIKALPLVPNVYEILETADLVITKTGGITTFECIFANLPLITYKPFLPQERLNAEFLEEKNAGKIMWDNSKNPYNLIMSIINNNELITMSENMKKIQREFDTSYAEKIIKLCEKKYDR